MAIRLISKDERFTVEIEECEFYYRRIPADIKQQIVRENTKRGKTDDNGVMEDGFRYAVLGWGGKVPTLSGEPAEFNFDNLIALPDPVKAKLTVCIFGSIDGEEVESTGPFGI